MRILQVIHDFIPEVRAGSELYTYYLSSELTRRGHSVLAFYPTQGETEVVRKNVAGVECLTFPNHSNPLGIFSDFNPRVDELFTQVLNEFRPDVVHLQSLLYQSLNIVDIAKRFGAKIVYTLHDYWLLCPRISLLAYDNHICSQINRIKCVECCKRIVRLESVPQFHAKAAITSSLLRKCEINKNAYAYLKNDREGFIRKNIFPAIDLFIAPSRFLRGKMIENGIDEGKIIYLDYGSEYNSFSEVHNRSQDAKRFAFVGTILPHKGIETLIEAFNGVTDAQLKIYGKLSIHNQSYPDLVRNPKIRFMGEVDEQEKKKAFEEIDALIVPSIWYENSPVTIHEAFMAHIPVIASNLGGMAEYVRHMENGLLFKTGDAFDLRSQIRFLIDNPVEYRRLKKGAPKMLSTREHVDIFEKLYRSLGAPGSTLQRSIDLSAFDYGEYAYRKETEPLWFLKSSWKTLKDAFAASGKVPVKEGGTIRRLSRDEVPAGTPVDVVFGGKVVLISFANRLDVDGKLFLQYTWRLKGKIPKRASVFVHFCEGEKIVFQQDHALLNGQLLLKDWRLGERIEENYSVDIHEHLTRDRRLTVKLGVVNPQTQQRMKVAASNGKMVDDGGTRVVIGDLDYSSEKSRKREAIDVSVVIPTKNAGESLEATLQRVTTQQTNRACEVLVVDSGSTDGTLAICYRFGVRVVKVDPRTFNHGLTRNQGIINARGAFIIMLVQDAVPTDDRWLDNIMKNFVDERVAGVFCRQIPRETADVLTKRNLNSWLTARSSREVKYIADRAAYDTLPPMEKYLFCVFDDVCSCIRRSVWQRFPFPETEFAEDLYYSKNVLEAGYKIVYEPDAAVMHSHDRTAKYEYERTYICHRRLYELFRLQLVPKASMVWKFTLMNIRNDASYLFEHEKLISRKLAMLMRIPFLSFASVYGQFRGARDQQQLKTLKVRGRV